MKPLIVGIVLIVGGFFAWKKFHTEPPPVTSPDKTPGADVQNRINNRTGFVDP